MSMTGPYVWSGMDARQQQQLWDDAIKWFDRAAQRMKAARRGEPAPPQPECVPPAPPPQVSVSHREACASTGPVRELAELAEGLVARGVPAWSALIDMMFRFDLIRRAGRAALKEPKLPYFVVCAAYGLDPDRWNPIDDWGKTTADDALADGIATVEQEGIEAMRRSHHVAGYLLRNSTKPVARAIVEATEKIVRDFIVESSREQLCAS